MNRNLPNRVEMGGAGVGEISDAAIERKAMDIARSDGRRMFNLKDVEEARQQIISGGKSEPADEEIALEERAGTGDPPVSHGTQAFRVLPDDEISPAEDLIREGVEEAESDTRLHSNDSDQLQ